MRRRALLAAAALAGSAAADWHRGIVFGGDEWTFPENGYGTPQSLLALQALRETGATHVRILFTQYVASINSSQIFPILGPSPLASSTPAQVEAAIKDAAGLGLNVTLCPIIDPSWDVPTNGRSGDLPPYIPSATPVSRLQIGESFSESDWRAFFASYTAFIGPYVALAGKYHPSVSLFEVGSELDVAFTTRAADWRAVVAGIRAVYPGPLTLAADSGTVSSITWWDALDFVGVDMYQGLGKELPLGQAPAVSDLLAGWQPILSQLAAAHAATGKPVIITETGYQSRPSCHVRPWGTVDRDPEDDSAWLENHDPACQANAYEALFQALTPQPWFAGVYFWLWRSDPTHGGTGDSDFTPHGKPAEAVLRRWYGNYTCTPGGAYDGLLMRPPRRKKDEQAEEDVDQSISGSISGSSSISAGFEMRAEDLAAFAAKFGSDEREQACDGSAAVAAAVRESSEAHAARARAARPAGAARQRVLKKHWNGFDLGGPDEWSSPYYRFDSAGARSSVDAALALGADAMEVIAQWYFSNVTSTEVYPITDPASPLRTSTDDELSSIMAYIKGKGARVILTLMLDPDWTLPAQSFCRGNPSHSPACYWRGQLGQYWNSSDCGAGGDWGRWFAGYVPVLVHYARLGQSFSADAFLVSHELQAAASVCPDLWAGAIQQVRAVFAGQVSAAFQPNLLDPAQLATVPYVKDLDFIGIDCYLQYPQPAHPSLPWNDTAQAAVTAAFGAVMPKYAAVTAATGKKIVCTEVGWSSRPWSYSGGAGMPKLDPEDCSVWDQCVSGEAQASAYTAFFQTYYEQDWFDGVLWWTWRADPTVGGTSDDGFSPAGKPSAGVIASYWT